MLHRMEQIVHAQLYHLQSVMHQPQQATTTVFQSGMNTLTLVKGQTYILGRSPKKVRKRKAESSDVAELVKLFDSQRVLSRVHAKLVFDPQGNQFILSDLSSSKRVNVNGVSVPSPNGVALANGDVVSLSRKGNYEFVFVTCHERSRLDERQRTSEEVSPVSGEASRTPKRMRTSDESEGGESPLDKAIARLENVAARLEEKHSQEPPVNIPETNLKERDKDKDKDKNKNKAKETERDKPEINHKATQSTATVAGSVADDLDLKDAIKRELTCCLCNDLMRVPTILPCSHGFCKVCVQQWLFKRMELGKSAACPTCKKKCLPKAGSGEARIMCQSVQLENVVAKFTSDRPPMAVASTGKEFHELFDYDDATSEDSGHSSTKQEDTANLCEFCGEDAHEDGNCPHRASDDANSGNDSD